MSDFAPEVTSHERKMEVLEQALRDERKIHIMKLERQVQMERQESSLEDPGFLINELIERNPDLQKYSGARFEVAINPMKDANPSLLRRLLWNEQAYLREQIGQMSSEELKTFTFVMNAGQVYRVIDPTTGEIILRANIIDLIDEV
ncbi:hypothetical protein KC669_03475 [Candidatus Dojkabacteria bacterium]|uniref:Uncharacterized protein n=1 Tax=Candidatus Dojkabacteria bacterium TaxID=2099670 RepID=A0A955RLH2_9BACT|nr:hypothetical protein [Candidatus Dojkabacteria bacterium]